MAGELSVKSGEDGQKMTTDLLKLTGWTLSEHIQYKCVMQDKHDCNTHNIDGLFQYESPLNHLFNDVILISAKHYRDGYGSNRKKRLNDAIKDLAESLECCPINADLKEKYLGTTTRRKRFFGLLVFLSSNEEELTKDLIQELQEDIVTPRNEFEAIYILDNFKVSFLVSAYRTAKLYRPDAKLKYLFHHTGSNQDPEQLYLTDTLLPIELMNSSLIPIVLESAEKTSVLIFCNNKFDAETLKRLIWLSHKLSGLANEIVIYLPDFDITRHEATEKSIKQSFKDFDVLNKIAVRRYYYHSFLNLKEDNPLNVITIPAKEKGFEYNKAEAIKTDDTIDKILPYGEMLKPLLGSSQLGESELKKFLLRKGILIKDKDKDGTIPVFANMLLSPLEINELKEMLQEKEDRLKSISRHAEWVGKSTDLQTAIIQINEKILSIKPEVNCKLIENNDFMSKKEDYYELEVKLERTSATKDLITGITQHEARVGVYLENGKVYVKCEYTAPETKKYIEKIVTEINKTFVEKGNITSPIKSILFRDFGSHAARIDFLLSFSKVKASDYFYNPDIENIKFRPDPDVKDIPSDLAKMKDKVTNLDINGNNLDTLDYLTEDKYKSCILLERIIIKFDFQFQDNKGICIAEIGFPSTLNNKRKIDYDTEFETSIKLPNLKANKGFSMSNSRLQNALSRKLDELVRMKYNLYNSPLVSS